MEVTISLIHPSTHQHLPGVFNLTEKFAPVVSPKSDETLAEVPKRDPNTSAKGRREAGVQQLPSDSQAVEDASPTALRVAVLQSCQTEAQPAVPVCRARVCFSIEPGAQLIGSSHSAVISVCLYTRPRLSFLHEFGPWF